MHDLNWHDLRYVLALARTGSHAAAARQLAIDPTTIARRLRAIELALDVRLFERAATGELRPSQAGEIVLRRAETVEAEIGGMMAAVKGADAIAHGTVRVTAVPILINRVLMPAAAGLLAHHPGLRLELVAEPRGLNLTRRETDIALRLARPDKDVGAGIIVRRVGTLGYAPYAARRLLKNDRWRQLPWLDYEDGMAHLPQARWIARAAQKENGNLANIAVNDAETLLQAALLGHGRALLPSAIADQVPGIARLETDVLPLPARELWLLTHPDLRHLARMQVVLDWIDATAQAFIQP